MCVCVEFWKIETKAELKVCERINEYEAFKNEKKNSATWREDGDWLEGRQFVSQLNVEFSI